MGRKHLVLFQAQNDTKEERDRIALRVDTFAEGLAEGEARGLAEGKAEGKAEGLTEGEARGKLLGQIQLLQSLLKIASPAESELAEMDQGQLQVLAASLHAKLG